MRTSCILRLTAGGRDYDNRGIFSRLQFYIEVYGLLNKFLDRHGFLFWLYPEFGRDSGWGLLVIKAGN